MHNADAWRYKLPDAVDRSISQECRNIIDRMLEPNPQNRITIADIRSHMLVLLYSLSLLYTNKGDFCTKYNQRGLLIRNRWTTQKLNTTLESVPLPRRLDEDEMDRVALLNISQSEEEIECMLNSLVTTENHRSMHSHSYFSDEYDDRFHGIESQVDMILCRGTVNAPGNHSYI